MPRRGVWGFWKVVLWKAAKRALEALGHAPLATVVLGLVVVMVAIGLMLILGDEAAASEQLRYLAYTGAALVIVAVLTWLVQIVRVVALNDAGRLIRIDRLIRRIRAAEVTDEKIARVGEMRNEYSGLLRDVEDPPPGSPPEVCREAHTKWRLRVRTLAARERAVILECCGPGELARLVPTFTKGMDLAGFQAVVRRHIDVMDLILTEMRARRDISLDAIMREQHD